METCVYVPSLNRANKIITDLPEMIFVVPKSQVRTYQKAHPQHTTIGHPERLQDIGAVRQWIIDQHEGDILLMCDDDVRLFTRNPTTRKLTKCANAAKPIGALYDAIDVSGYGMASIGMRLFNNTKPDIQEWYHCHTIWAINKSLLVDHNIRIPPVCKVQEDLYLALTLGAHGYANIVFHKWAQESGAGGQPGGCANYRTSEMQRLASEYIASLYPRYVKVNPNPKKLQHNVRVYWKRLANDITR